jgi:hypothetical protein
MDKKILCKNCNRKLNTGKIYCSRKCRFKFEKRNKIGWFNSELQKELCKRANGLGGKNAQKTQKKFKLGLYGLTKKQRKEHCIKIIKMQKRKKLAFFNSKLQSELGKRGAKKANEINKKNKTGFYNSITQRENGKKVKLETHIKSGLLSIRSHRINIRNLKLYGQYYDSKSEIEISLCLQNQFNYIPKENKTLHVRIGRCEYDYLLEKFKLYIEYHPWDLKFTEEEYYNRRRENLNKNGYNDYNLVVIK